MRMSEWWFSHGHRGVTSQYGISGKSSPSHMQHAMQPKSVSCIRTKKNQEHDAMHARFELSPMMRLTILSSTNLVLARSSRVGKLRLHPLHHCTYHRLPPTFMPPSSSILYARHRLHSSSTPSSLFIFYAVFSLHLQHRPRLSSTPSSSLYSVFSILQPWVQHDYGLDLRLILNATVSP